MSEDDELEKLYKPREVAEYFGVSYHTVRSWLQSGTIKGIKVGSGKGRWRVKHSEMKRLAKERHGDSGADS
jgi:excisionase family DNA binding protein